MNSEKVIYIIISSLLLAIFILFTFVFSSKDLSTVSSSNLKTIYFVDHISSAHQKVIDLFNKKYEGSIKVETINLSFEKFSTNERKELLARYLRNKNDRIDVFCVDQIWVPRFARWALTLNNLISQNDIDNIIPNALQTCSYKDTLIAVPLYIDIAVMLYRQDLLKKLRGFSSVEKELNSSISWDEMIALHQQNQEIKNPFYIFQGDDFEGLLCVYYELLASQGNHLIDENGKILINSPAGRKALKLLVDFVNRYKISPKEVALLKENESFRYFAKNNGIFIRVWSSMFDDKVEYLTEEQRANLKIAPLPHLENISGSAAYGGWNLMISQFSEKIPEVIKFVKFLLSEESQKIMYEEGGYLPVRKNLYEDSVFINKHEELLFFKKLFNTGVHRPFLEGYTNISDIISYYVNRALKQELSVEQALIEADTKIRQKVILVK